jgi:hypothetical protein
MNAVRTAAILPVLLGAALLLPGTASSAGLVVSSAEIVPNESLSRSVAVRDVTVRGGDVSGVVVNTSQTTVRDVELLIRHQWLWDNEFRPGTDDPSRASYVTLPLQLAPGEQAEFTYQARSPLPDRPDGRFQTSVAVAGFVEVTR